MFSVEAKILYLQRYSIDFRNLCISSKMLTVGVCVESFSYTGILVLHWQGENLRNDNIWNFALLTCTLCQQKSRISKGIHPIFEIFPSARRYWGCAFGWKVPGAQVFYFCNGKVRTLRIVNIWYFATFNMYSVPDKILYLQRYWTDFRKHRLSSKMLRVDICVESFMCAGILFCNGELGTLRIENI